MWITHHLDADALETFGFAQVQCEGLVEQAEAGEGRHHFFTLNKSDKFPKRGGRCELSDADSR